MIDYGNFPLDMRDLVTLALRDLIVRDGVGGAFQVVYQHVDTVEIDPRVVNICLYREDFDQPEYTSGCHENRKYSIRVGIKETVNQYPRFGDRQLGRFLQALGTNDWPKIEYNFAYKKTPIKYLTELGVNKVTCSEVQSYQPDQSTYISEFRVTFSVAFSILQPTLS